MCKHVCAIVQYLAAAAPTFPAFGMPSPAAGGGYCALRFQAQLPSGLHRHGHAPTTAWHQIAVCRLVCWLLCRMLAAACLPLLMWLLLVAWLKLLGSTPIMPSMHQCQHTGRASSACCNRCASWQMQLQSPVLASTQRGLNACCVDQVLGSKAF
jgi:hypothetical protein